MPGPAPTPNEVLRKRGGHGHGWRLSSVTPPAPKLPQGKVPRTPPKGLGGQGRALWRFVVKVAPEWLAESDVPMLRQACDTLDEAVELRAAAMQSDDAAVRASLLTRSQNARKLHLQALSSLGFSPADRARYNLGEVSDDADPLAQFRQGRPA